ncbi:hypothetical protein [Parasitella parasitica]|uniref:Ras-GEF domain-containing protein n=1 Tax=Parasitella parasitica TaxID=35722 RepID=A0A0B7NA88_9FUNG|nr:hypothetical protein [Parasitella parasitica]
MRLPLIPLSPYIHTSCEYAKVLAQTTKSLSEEESASIRTLLEKNLHKEREKLDRLTENMQSIQSSCLLDFNIYDIAKEIAYINCSLFRMVTLDKHWLCIFDKQSNIVPLLDFHRYLSHSFAHQIIYGDPKRKSVIQLIHLAYILLHVYRDFSGCTAILRSLYMPEVRRLQGMWEPCPPKLIQVYEELVAMLSPDNNYEAYHHQLWVHTNRFLNITPSKSQMIAIPFMQAHLATIQQLVQTHASVQAAADVVLSSAGQPLLDSTVHLLEFCQQFSEIDPPELEKYSSPPASATVSRRLSFQSSVSSSNRRSSILGSSKAIKLSTSPCLNLDHLRSNAKVYHWIVSRAYLSRSQLHSESLHVEPLAVGENELEVEEEDDLYWVFFNKDFAAKDTATEALKKDPPTKPSRSPSKAILTGNQDPVQETVDGLDVVDNSDHTTDQTAASLISAVNTNDAQNSEQEAAAAAEEPTSSISKGEPDDSAIAADNAALEANDDKPNTLNIQTLETNEEQEQQPNEENQEQPEEETNKQTSENEPAKVQDVQGSVALPPSPLLPSASSNMLQVDSQGEDSKKTSSIVGNDDDDDEDDLVILTEEDKEKWTGYPFKRTLSPTFSETGEEEKWTGYPIPKEEEDDEEVWKGYPMPSSEKEYKVQQQQQGFPSNGKSDDDKGEESPVVISLPSTPSEEEEWKGYKNEQQQQQQQQQQQTIVVTTDDTASDIRDPHISSWNDNNGTSRNSQTLAAGNTTAVRMQYSVSTTVTNSRTLPSPFAPSSST